MRSEYLLDQKSKIKEEQIKNTQDFIVVSTQEMVYVLMVTFIDGSYSIAHAFEIRFSTLY